MKSKNEVLETNPVMLENRRSHRIMRVTSIVLLAILISVVIYLADKLNEINIILPYAIIIVAFIITVLVLLDKKHFE